MADLDHLDRTLFEQLLGMGGGYVLDFTDPEFQSFFNDFGIDIERPEFHKFGRSKAKRMRAFWELAPNAQAGRVLEALCRIVEEGNPQNAHGPVEEKHRAIVQRLLGRLKREPRSSATEKEFLEQEFGTLQLSRLSLDAALEATITQRLREIRQCLGNEAPLGAVLLSGSMLEGLLLNQAVNNPQRFNTAQTAPKTNGKVRPFQDWTLNDYINVAHECGMLSLDVKKYAHALRDFRNYIHPFQQAHSGFRPDAHTARISWQVLRAAIADLAGTR